mmetsp:Transcript_22872/g.65354  ORF Transcript_22872/g.65354 Transcript_22872/m.65354 type:complete len:430 (-) Transcript_22872:130-1419(-)
MSETRHARGLDTSWTRPRPAGPTACAVDHDHRLVRPLAQRAAVCDVARALRLGGVGDLRDDRVELEALEEPGYLEPAEPHQLDDVPLLISPDRPALVELLEERAVRGRGVEHRVCARPLAPLEGLGELDVDRLRPVLAVRVPAHEADEQVERDRVEAGGAEPAADSGEDLQLRLGEGEPLFARDEALDLLFGEEVASLRRLRRIARGLDAAQPPPPLLPSAAAAAVGRALVSGHAPRLPVRPLVLRRAARGRHLASPRAGRRLPLRLGPSAQQLLLPRRQDEDRIARSFAGSSRWRGQRRGSLCRKIPLGCSGVRGGARVALRAPIQAGRGRREPWYAVQGAEALQPFQDRRRLGRRLRRSSACRLGRGCRWHHPARRHHVGRGLRSLCRGSAGRSLSVALGALDVWLRLVHRLVLRRHRLSRGGYGGG